MAVVISNRNTGKIGHMSCPYGCCGEVNIAKNKPSMRRAVRRVEKREFKREVAREQV
jgi:hypothetical protein